MSDVLMFERMQATESVRSAAEHFDMFEVQLEALHLIEIRDTLPKAPVEWQERWDNSRTALMEAMTESSFISEVELTGTLEEIHWQMLTRALNGWDDSLPVHEKQRRFFELCEILVNHKVDVAIEAGELPPETKVGVVSDCPPEDAVGDKIGYRFKNKKGMVRSVGLRDNQNGTYTRVIEQVSRSNATHHTTLPFLAENNVPVDETLASDIAGLQALFIHDLVDGAISVTQRLDRYAGENIVCGEVKGSKPTYVEYSQMREESRRREAEVDVYIGGLAELEEDLSQRMERGMSPEKAKKIFQDEVIRTLEAICTLAPQYAETTFGKAAASGFYEASYWTAMGNQERARAALDATEHLRETVLFCGMSISVAEAQALGLPVNSYEDLVELGRTKWRQGVCQIPSCVTRPNKTDVGECDICRLCQVRFDSGGDPTTDFSFRAMFEEVMAAAKAKKAETSDNVVSLDQKRQQKQASEVAWQKSTIEAQAA